MADPKSPLDPRYPGHGYDPLDPHADDIDSHGGDGHDAHGHDAHGHGPSGIGKYLLVFVALLGLTLVSFAVGNSQSLRENAPGAMWGAMMAVSCIKAMLVIMFFMHMLWEANWKYVLTIPASMMSIFLLLMLIPDIGRRTNRYSEERWLYAAQPQTNSHAIAAEAAKTHDKSHAGHSDAAGHSEGAGHEPAAGHK